MLVVGDLAATECSHLRHSLPPLRFTIHRRVLIRGRPASTMSETRVPKLDAADKEKLKKAFDVSHFDLNAILRGAQLTLVGGMRHPSPRYTALLRGSS